jgi:glycosyltransferase involved in cell wall biosynthesis
MRGLSRTVGSGTLSYRELVQRFRDLLCTTLPRGATVAVVSKGDDELLRLNGVRGWHYPQTREGAYVGHHPGSSAEAILYLETLRAKGASYLAFPKTALWWLEYYSEFKEHICRQYNKILEAPDTGIVFELGFRGLKPERSAGEPVSAKCISDPHFAGQNDSLFDAEWYLQQNPELASAGVDPHEHYLSEGARQGRSPHPLFDAKFYWKSYPETVLAGQSPLEHYLTIGWKKGYRPNPNFDPTFYLSAYPDVAAAGFEPLTHFASAGLKEGRVGNPEQTPVEPYRADFRISRRANAYQTQTDESVRAIAFHLPQFHPIRENDRWWGKGFTEWDSVRRGRPQFRGHYQPHVPSTLGYYDLGDPDALERQATLARENGIHGFCFYYYWFAGKVLLDRPLRKMIATGKPDVPFCICWANENWTRRWDGMEHEILIAQQHSPDDDLAFLRKVEPILLHPNYIRIANKPLLIVYRPGILPDARATTERWRDHFRARGHGEIYLAMTRAFDHKTTPAEYGFDAAIQFPPHKAGQSISASVPGKKRSFNGTVYDYERTKKAFLEELVHSGGETLLPGVMPSWDNTARRQGSARIWAHSSPESYYAWLSAALNHLRRNRPPEERVIFINAWNEWGEGCHLEPDTKYGHAWLNATRLALQSPGAAKKVIPNGSKTVRGVRSTREKRAPLEVAFVSHDAHPHGAQYALLTLAAWLKRTGLVAPRFIIAGSGSLMEEFARLGPILRFDGLTEARTSSGEQVVRVLRSFCGPNLAAVYVNSAAAGHVCRWTKKLAVPHVVHVHELEQSIRRWVGRRKISAIRSSADMIVAASEPVARNLRATHRIAPQRIAVVHEFIRCTGVPPATTAARNRVKSWLGLDPRAKIVLGCGTTDWRKGPDLFVEVAAEVRRKCRFPVQFIWVGKQSPAEAEELRQLVASEHLSDTVKFVGAVATPLPYMLASDLFLLPSREDPFPLVCLEAADCGLPIVCFAKAGGMPDFVAPDCGAVVPYLNVQRMYREVVSFLEDDRKVRLCGSRAREKVRGRFDVSVKGREIYNILEGLCFDRSRGRSVPQVSHATPKSLRDRPELQPLPIPRGAP